MNYVDLIVLAVVAISALIGFLRGLVREVLGLAAWVGAAAAAAWSYPKLLGLVRQQIPNPDIADPVAFGITFVIVLIALSVVARVIGGAVRRSVLGGLDRTFGLLYGLARGAALAIAAYLLAGVVEPVDQWPDKVLEARALPSIYRGAEWFARKLPENYRPVVSAPPPERQASADELLQANPAGRASGPPVARR